MRQLAMKDVSVNNYSDAPSSVRIKNAVERFFHVLFLVSGSVSILFVVLITVFLVMSGIPAIREIGLFDFLFGKVWNAQTNTFGILPFVLTSVYGTVIATIISFPIGILTALFLSKAAPPKIETVIHKSVELLSGIPSVIFGLVGLIVIVPVVQKIFSLSSGANLFSAIVILQLMILPYIITISETALREVPREYEEASLALGATKIETYFLISVRAAKSGIMSAVIQAVGRAIGEAMAIIMVSGNVVNMPHLFSSVRFLTTAIVSEMSYASYGSLQRNALFSIGLVLFFFIMVINVFLHFMKREKL